LDLSGSENSLVAGCFEGGCEYFGTVRNYQLLKDSMDLESMLLPMFKLYD
jgi:hypothetical protein